MKTKSEMLAEDREHNVIMGTDKNDDLYGTDGDDEIYGGSGDDELVGMDGNDYFEGGTGNDRIRGGGGNSIIQYNIGDGCDGITLSDGENVIQFGEGIQASDLRFRYDGWHYDGIAVQLGEETILRLEDYLESGGNTLMKFADGTVLTPAEILSALEGGYSGTEEDDVYDGTEIDMVQKIAGGDGDDTLKGGKWADVIYGDNGNDTLKGQEGDDYITGEEGNDKLYGGAGDDELGGGDGNDYYEGGKGDDTIDDWHGDTTIGYNAGDGFDQIDLYDGKHVIQFGEGIQASDLKFGPSRYFEGMCVYLGEEVILEIKRMMKKDMNLSMMFADGTVLKPDEIRSAVEGIYAGTEENDVYDGLDITVRQKIQGNGGNDILKGGIWGDEIGGGIGDDKIYGREGNDNIDGGKGNNQLYGGAGDDYLLGDDGDDYYEGGKGNDMIEDWGGDTAIQYTLGDGCDEIFLNEGKHVIQFGQGIQASDLEFTSNGEENRGVFVYFKKDQILNLMNFIEDDLHISMKFSDGTVMLPEEILSQMGTGYYGTEGDDVYDGTDADIEQIIHGRGGNDTLKGGKWNDEIYGGDGNDTLYGNDGNDVIQGDAGNDRAYGGAGDDELKGGWGDDYYEGGKGNDDIHDRYGNTTVRYNLGDGFDVINLYVGENTIQFGEGINPSDIQCTLNENGRGVFVYLGEEKILDLEEIDDYINDISMKFSDGTTWGFNEILKDVEGFYYGTKHDDVYDGTGVNVEQNIKGKGGDDILKGGTKRDELYGGAGNDTLEGNDGNDYIVGGIGNDRYYGGAGDDQLRSERWQEDGDNYYEGGTGNDFIGAWRGNAVIAYNKGDGIDTIKGISEGQDATIRFGEGIEKKDIALVLGDNSNDMEMMFGGSKILAVEKLGRYASSYTFEFADGSSVTGAEYCKSYNWKFGTGEDDVIKDENNNNIVYGLYGNDILYGGEGNDELHGNSEEDTLYGGAGDDYLNGGFDNDVLWGGDGNDTLKGSRGKDYLYGEAGDDVYLIGKYTGIDYITESSGEDTIVFEKAFKAEDAIISHNGTALEIGFNNINSKVVVQDYFKDSAHKIEQITFEADGAVWDQATLESKVQTQQLAQAMAGFSPVEAVGSTTLVEPVKGMELQLAAAV